MSDKPSRENKRQYLAFLAYSQMSEPSVQKLWESWEKITTLAKIKKPALSTMEWWCKRHDWVIRSEAIQGEAKEKATKKAVENVTMKDKEILAVTRVVMIRYGQQLKDNNQGKISMGDFKDAVLVQRTILGESTEIGKHEVEISDKYQELNDEQILERLEHFAKRVKEKLKQKNVKDND